MKDDASGESGLGQEMAALRLHVQRLKDERTELQNEIIELRRQLRRTEEKVIDAARVKKRLETIMSISYEVNSPLQQLLSLMDLEPNEKYKTLVGSIASTLKRIRELEGLTAEAAEPSPTAVDEGLEGCAANRVMIVDDEEPIRELFGKILHESMPDVVMDFAVDGQKAVDLFKEWHQSVIVMDIAMPVMNGEVAFIEIQRMCFENGWKMPAVIFCTGFAPPESIKNLRMGEGHCYLPKPVTSSTLVQAVRERLAWRAKGA